MPPEALAPDAIPTDDMLGTYTTDVPAEPSPEATPAEPAKAPEPEKQPEPAPVPDTGVDPEGKQDDDEDFTLEDLDERMKANMREFAAERDAEARKAEEAATLTPEQTRIAELEAENKRLATEHAAATAKVQREADEAKWLHEINSTAGKFKMSEAEVAATGKYFEDNPDLIGQWSFERAALRVHPEIRDRMKGPTTAAPDNGPAGNGAAPIVTGGANGAGPPKPFQHTPKARDYSDITSHLLSSGEAAKLGSYV